MMLAAVIAASLTISGTVQSSMLVEVSPTSIRLYEVNLPAAGTAERCIARTEGSFAEALREAGERYPDRHLVRDVATSSCDSRLASVGDGRPHDGVVERPGGR